MTEADFDKCPSCGSYGIYGLRCHPKFAVCVGVNVGGDPDMAMFYAHSEDHLKALVGMLPPSDVLYKQRWNGSAWEDFH